MREHPGRWADPPKGSQGRRRGHGLAWRTVQRAKARLATGYQGRHGRRMWACRRRTGIRRAPSTLRMYLRTGWRLQDDDLEIPDFSVGHSLTPSATITQADIPRNPRRGERVQPRSKSASVKTRVCSYGWRPPHGNSTEMPPRISSYDDASTATPHLADANATRRNRLVLSATRRQKSGYRARSAEFQAAYEAALTGTYRRALRKSKTNLIRSLG